MMATTKQARHFAVAVVVIAVPVVVAAVAVVVIAVPVVVAAVAVVVKVVA